MSDKILITGGAGFVGFHLAKKLAKTSTVHLCDNLFRGRIDEDLKELLKNKNVNFIKCDLTNADELKSLDNDYDYVYHLAAVQGTKNFYEIPDKVLRTNILSTINVLDWFSHKSGKILFSSSSEAYAGTIRNFSGKVPTPEDIPLCVDDIKNPRWSYGASKIAGELLFLNYARARKFRMSIIRYHNVYGPRMGFDHVIPEFSLRLLKKEEPFKIYGGKETRAFCFVDDAVAATELVMRSEKTNNEVVNIGMADEISILEVARKMFDIANFHPRVQVLPAPQGSVQRRCPDTKRLQNLGFKGKISLDQGLKRTYEWYKVHS